MLPFPAGTVETLATPLGGGEFLGFPIIYQSVGRVSLHINMYFIAVSETRNGDIIIASS